MLIELLRQAVAQSPEQPAVISPGGSESYAECLARSERIAAGLHGRSIARFGSTVQAPGDVLALLAASSAVGSSRRAYIPPNSTFTAR